MTKPKTKNQNKQDRESSALQTTGPDGEMPSMPTAANVCGVMTYYRLREGLEGHLQHGTQAGRKTAWQKRPGPVPPAWVPVLFLLLGGPEKWET